MRFYTLGDPMVRSAFWAKVGVERLELLWGAKRGVHLDDPLPIFHSGGNSLRDFIWASLAPIVSGRIIRLLNQNNITGWTVYPVRVVDRRGNSVPDYHGLGVTGRCAWIGFDRREAALVWRPNVRGDKSPFFVGLHLAEEAWDGSDIFVGEDLTKGGSWIVVTENVYNLFREYKVTNCELRPLEEVELLAQQSAIIPSQ